MLTPQEVSGKTFPKASSFTSGYQMASVDEFLDTVTEDYTSLYKENAALKAKLKVLAEKVEEYRATEDAMRSTLLAAQRMATSMAEEAEQKSRKLLENAQAESKRILDEAYVAAAVANRDFEQKTADASAKLELAQREMREYIAQSLDTCRRQIAFFEQLPDYELLQQTQTAPEEEQPVQQSFAIVEQPMQAEPQSEPEQSESAEKPAMGQDTIRIVGKEIVAAYEAQQEEAETPTQPENDPEPTKPIEPIRSDVDFASEFKLNLDELQFGRNYGPDKKG